MMVMMMMEMESPIPTYMTVFFPDAESRAPWRGSSGGPPRPACASRGKALNDPMVGWLRLGTGKASRRASGRGFHVTSPSESTWTPGWSSVGPNLEVCMAQFLLHLQQIGCVKTNLNMVKDYQCFLVVIISKQHYFKLVFTQTKFFVGVWNCPVGPIW